MRGSTAKGSADCASNLNRFSMPHPDHRRVRGSGFRRMRKALVKAIGCDSGVTAIEYAMIGGLIAIAIVTGATQIGSNISGFFNSIANAF